MEATNTGGMGIVFLVRQISIDQLRGRDIS